MGKLGKSRPNPKWNTDLSKTKPMPPFQRNGKTVEANPQAISKSGMSKMDKVSMALSIGSIGLMAYSIFGSGGGDGGDNGMTDSNGVDWSNPASVMKAYGLCIAGCSVSCCFCILLICGGLAVMMMSMSGGSKGGNGGGGNS
jgi:hypothetical protein